MTTDLNRLSYATDDELMMVIVPARRITLIYFLAPPIAIFSIVAVVTIYPIFHKSDLPIIGATIFSLFFFIFLYMGVTSLLALLWTLFGNDCLTIDKKGIRVDRVLFFKFSSNYYQNDKIFNIYVNSRDYVVNKGFKREKRLFVGFPNGDNSFSV
jgi:hypothetical protein